jgi:hypothetical protein
MTCGIFLLVLKSAVCSAFSHTTAVSKAVPKAVSKAYFEPCGHLASGRPFRGARSSLPDDKLGLLASRVVWRAGLLKEEWGIFTYNWKMENFASSEVHFVVTTVSLAVKAMLSSKRRNAFAPNA